jgi:hypothetical protein
MKNKLITQAAGLLFLGLVLGGCSDDNDSNPTPVEAVKLAFEEEVHEPGGDVTSYEIVIKLLAPAQQDGKVMVGLAGKMVYGQNYTTEPAASNGLIQIGLIKGQTVAKIKVNKLNDVQNGENILQMILKEPSKGYELGDPAISLLRFRKTPALGSSVSFASATADLWEDDTDGLTIHLLLSNALDQAELVTIDFESSAFLVYGEDYTTDPALVLHEMRLEIPAGQTSASFKVMPVDNNRMETDYLVTMSITTTTGYLTKGDISEFSLNFRDDDDVQGIEIHSISALRAKFEEYPGDWYLPQDYYIEGVITSATNVGDGKTAYIQDAGAGIMLRFNPENKLHYGDKVRLNLKNASGSTVNGQKSITNISDLSGTLLDEGVTVVPMEISLEQLFTGNFEGMRVRISGVRFNDADGSATFEGNRLISNGTYSVVVKTYPEAEFRTAVLPEGLISIQGIVGDFGYLQPQDLMSDISLD